MSQQPVWPHHHGSQAFDADLWRQTVTRMIVNHSLTYRMPLCTELAKLDAELDAKSRDDDPYVRADAATYAIPPEHVLERLAADPQPAIRALVAGQPGLRPAMVRLLAGDPYEQVRAMLANNLSLDLSVDELGALAADPSPLVRAWIVYRPETTSDLLARLADDEDEDVRALVAGDSRTPGSTLEALSDDPSAQVRQAASATLSA